MGTSGLPRRATCGLVAAALLVSALMFLAPGASAAGRKGGAPTTPTDLRVTSTTASSVSLAWNPSTDRKMDRLRYIVVDSRGFGTLVWHPKTTMTITSLTPGATYSFHVYAEDESWNRSGNSNTVTATLPHDTTPPTAPALSVTVVSPSQVYLSWTASTDDIPSNIAGYRVLVEDALATNVVWVTGESARVRHLTPATSYSFTVEARDRSGNVATSNAVSVTTEASTDTEAPTAPSNLRFIEERGDCEVVFAWDPATDNLDPQSVLEYEIYANGVLGEVAPGTSIHTYGSRGAESTSFVLLAVDRTGNTSAPSDALTLTISGC
jgi:chitodextrinase